MQKTFKNSAFGSGKKRKFYLRVFLNSIIFRIIEITPGYLI